ncbi:hypothetical protein HAX54_014683, partial [Datura stramonium]|nr:hypothetical protein [Datura stramonium]
WCWVWFWWCAVGGKSGDGNEGRGRGRRRRGVATAVAGSGEEKRGDSAARFGSPVGRREGEKRKGWRRRETVAGICMVSGSGREVFLQRGEVGMLGCSPATVAENIGERGRCGCRRRRRGREGATAVRFLVGFGDGEIRRRREKEGRRIAAAGGGGVLVFRRWLGLFTGVNGDYGGGR